jgi:Na+/glutamate symporter
MDQHSFHGAVGVRDHASPLLFIEPLSICFYDEIGGSGGVGVGAAYHEALASDGAVKALDLSVPGQTYMGPTEGI